MVSLLYQESVNYCFKRHNILYTCFMDAMKAFNCTWITGLIHKLYHLGITRNALIMCDIILRSGTSRVLAYGRLSSSFWTEQGTRQGSICSPFFYTFFMNELLIPLENSRQGLEFNSISLSVPTLPDDICHFSGVVKNVTCWSKTRLIHSSNFDETSC